MREELEFLKKLQKELNEGDHDAQAFPRYWSIMDYKTVKTVESEGETSVMFLPAHDMSGDPVEICEAFIKERGDNSIANYIADEVAALAWVKENMDVDAYLVYEKVESFIASDTMFLTKKEAEEYLEKYHYNHSPDAHTYAMTAYRAPNVEKLLKILQSLDWEKVVINE